MQLEIFISDFSVNAKAVWLRGLKSEMIKPCCLTGLSEEVQAELSLTRKAKHQRHHFLSLREKAFQTNLLQLNGHTSEWSISECPVQLADYRYPNEDFLSRSQFEYKLSSKSWNCQTGINDLHFGRCFLSRLCLCLTKLNPAEKWLLKHTWTKKNPIYSAPNRCHTYRFWKYIMVSLFRIYPNNTVLWHQEIPSLTSADF